MFLVAYDANKLKCEKHKWLRGLMQPASQSLEKIP